MLCQLYTDANYGPVACYFRMRRRDRYECDVPWTVSTACFALVKEKQSLVYKIGVHYDLKNSSIFPLEVNWNA